MNMLFIMAIMPCLFYYLIKGNKVLHMFQQNWYNEGNRYLRWLISGKYMNLINPDMFFVIFITTMFFDNMAFGCTLFAGFYLSLTYFFVKQKQREQVKKPLAFTARVRRLIVTELLIFLIPAVIFSITVNEYNFSI